MSGYIEIHWTSGSIDEARKVARFLVQERFVACAQIIPWVESIYTWNNQLETTQESKVVLKTKKDLFEPVKEIILKNCKYEVPEVISFEIQDINSSYLDWMTTSVNPKEVYRN